MIIQPRRDEGGALINVSTCMRRGCKLKMSTLKLVFAITLTVFGSSQAAECHGGVSSVCVCDSLSLCVCVLY